MFVYNEMTRKKNKKTYKQYGFITGALMLIKKKTTLTAVTDS